MPVFVTNQTMVIKLYCEKVCSFKVVATAFCAVNNSTILHFVDFDDSYAVNMQHIYKENVHGE